MHKEILSAEQIEMMPFVKQFIKEFYLVGGTAIALQIGHRRSIDFDLFKFSALNHKKILTRLSESGRPYIITRRVSDQMNVIIGDVTFTFLFPADPADFRRSRRSFNHSTILSPVPCALSPVPS